MAAPDAAALPLLVLLLGTVVTFVQARGLRGQEARWTGITAMGILFLAFAFAAIFETIGADPEQLVLWELIPGGENRRTDLAIGDRRRLGPLCRLVRRWTSQGDRKLAQLRALLEDRRPTIVFATSLETVRYLRDQLGSSGTACW